MYRRPASSWRNLVLWCLGAAVLVFLLSGKAGPGSGRFARSSSPARAANPLPKPAADAQALRQLADRGASADAQRAALERYLAGRRVSKRAIATVLRHTQNGVVLTDGPGEAHTRVGGRPLLPRGTPWPKDGKSPFTFVAAIDFAELPALDPLPREGTLALYRDMDPDSDIAFKDDIAATRAYYLPPGAPVDMPKAPGSTYPPDAHPLKGRVMPIAGEPHDVIEELGQGPELERLLKAMNELTNTEMYGDHHMLGTSLEVQDTPRTGLPAALKSPRSGFSAQSRARFSSAEVDPERWLLLAQINEEDDFLIADGGGLYFMILRSDLRARRFDRVVGVMDSH